MRRVPIAQIRGTDRTHRTSNDASRPRPPCRGILLLDQLGIVWQIGGPKNALDLRCAPALCRSQQLGAAVPDTPPLDCRPAGQRLILVLAVLLALRRLLVIDLLDATGTLETIRPNLLAAAMHDQGVLLPQLRRRLVAGDSIAQDLPGRPRSARLAALRAPERHLLGNAPPRTGRIRRRAILIVAPMLADVSRDRITVLEIERATGRPRQPLLAQAVEPCRPHRFEQLLGRFVAVRPNQAEHMVVRVPAMRLAMCRLANTDRPVELTVLAEPLPRLAVLHPPLRFGQPINHIPKGSRPMAGRQGHHHEAQAPAWRSGPLLELAQLPATYFADPGGAARAAPDRSARLNPRESGVILPFQQIDLVSGRGPKAVRHTKVRSQRRGPPLKLHPVLASRVF